MYIILQLCEAEPGCRVISIAIHYFFTVCFMFMFLEAIHMYGLVASVVKMKGMLATKQNIVVREIIMGCIMQRRERLLYVKYKLRK